MFTPTPRLPASVARLATRTMGKADRTELVSTEHNRWATSFDHDGLICNAGLIVTATLMVRLGLEQLTTAWVRTGAPNADRKICTLIAAMLAGASHIDHGGVVRAGATQAVLPFKVMAPSTIGTFLRSFTFGFVRQLDAVASRLLTRGWELGAGPGGDDLVVDLDSTICEVHGHLKQGAAYGYTPDRRHHAFITNRDDLDMVEADRFHRHHAVVELAIRDLKAGGAEHIPSGHYPANAAWFACAVIAHNLTRWASLLADQPIVTSVTFRTRYSAIPAVAVNRFGRHTLRTPTRWPWADTFTSLLSGHHTDPTQPIGGFSLS